MGKSGAGSEVLHSSLKGRFALEGSLLSSTFMGEVNAKRSEGVQIG